MRRLRIVGLGAVIALTAASAVGQFGFGGGRGRFAVQPNIAYDGRFTFVRVKFQTAPGGYWYGG
jgi:hypothetical protein